MAREIAFVLNSPAFFGVDAPAVALRQAPPGYEPRLPGPQVRAKEQVIACVGDADCLAWHNALNASFGAPALADRVARDLLPPASPESGRLGILFERIAVSLLRCRWGDAHVASAVAVRTGEGKSSTTWGEFDALVQRGDGHVEHWEMAVKFYLQIRPTPAWQHCVGPGVRDRLDFKGPKTFLQQLPLSGTNLGQTLAARVFPCDVVRPVAFTKGTVFYRLSDPGTHPSEAWKDGALPEGLAPGQAKGWWVSLRELSWVRDVWPEALLCPLPRLRWMAGLGPSEAKAHGETWDAFFEAAPARLAELGRKSECLLASLHDPDSGQELSRGFVVTPRFLTETSLE